MAESQAPRSSDKASIKGKPENCRFPGLQVVAVCLYPLKVAVIVVVSCVSTVYEKLRSCSSTPNSSQKDDVKIGVKTSKTLQSDDNQTQDEDYQIKANKISILSAKRMLALISQLTPVSVELVGIYSTVLSEQIVNVCKNTKVCAFKLKDCLMLGSVSVNKHKHEHSASSAVATWLLPSLLDAADIFNYGVDYLKGHNFPLNSYIPMIPVEQIELALEDEELWTGEEETWMTSEKSD